MPVQFVSNHYRNELGNPGEKQVGMKRFLILGFTLQIAAYYGRFCGAKRP